MCVCVPARGCAVGQCAFTPDGTASGFWRFSFFSVLRHNLLHLTSRALRGRRCARLCESSVQHQRVFTRVPPGRLPGNSDRCQDDEGVLPGSVITRATHHCQLQLTLSHKGNETFCCHAICGDYNDQFINVVLRADLFQLNFLENSLFSGRGDMATRMT